MEARGCHFSRRSWVALALGGALCLTSLSFGTAQAERHRQPAAVTVMSYNIFQGSELSHSLTAQTLSQLGPAVAADYENVIRSNIPARARALAAEIAANQPALVGLQEAVLWRIRSPAGPAPVAVPGTATHVGYDFVTLLVRALAARGSHYRAVAITDNLDIQATGDFSGGKKMDVRYTDRVAILVRRGVAISNVQDHNFVARDTVGVVGVPIPVPDGWASVDAKLAGRRFRFITTHLDGLDDSRAPAVRAAEAAEILNGPAKTTLPVLFICDCNSTPTTQTYSELVAAGLHDSWARIHRHQAGVTCCHRSSPTDLETDVADPHPNQGIVERIDYVFSHSPFTVSGITRLGTNRADRTRTKPPLWPSDHLGLVAHLLLR